MKFYDCATAPSPRRVRMFIAEKALEIPTIEVCLASGEQHGEAFGQLNPFRTVPALELDDGTVLNTTSGICHYLEALHPTPALMGEDAAQRGRVADLEWRIEQEGFLAVGESFRNRSKAFKNNALTGAKEYAQISELVDRGRTRAEFFMRWLDGQLLEREFVSGDQFTIADITAFVTLEFAKWIKLEPEVGLSNLHRWYLAVAARESANL